MSDSNRYTHFWMGWPRLFVLSLFSRLRVKNCNWNWNSNRYTRFWMGWQRGVGHQNCRCSFQKHTQDLFKGTQFSHRKEPFFQRKVPGDTGRLHIVAIAQPKLSCLSSNSHTPAEHYIHTHKKLLECPARTHIHMHTTHAYLLDCLACRVLNGAQYQRH